MELFPNRLFSRFVEQLNDCAPKRVGIGYAQGRVDLGLGHSRGADKLDAFTEPVHETGLQV